MVPVLRSPLQQIHQTLPLRNRFEAHLPAALSVSHRAAAALSALLRRRTGRTRRHLRRRSCQSAPAGARDIVQPVDPRARDAHAQLFLARHRQPAFPSLRTLPRFRCVDLNDLDLRTVPFDCRRTSSAPARLFGENFGRSRKAPYRTARCGSPGLLRCGPGSTTDSTSTVLFFFDVQRRDSPNAAGISISLADRLAEHIGFDMAAFFASSWRDGPSAQGMQRVQQAHQVAARRAEAGAVERRPSRSPRSPSGSRTGAWS